jgi:hypothetical protein
VAERVTPIGWGQVHDRPVVGQLRILGTQPPHYLDSLGGAETTRATRPTAIYVRFNIAITYLLALVSFVPLGQRVILSLCDGRPAIQDT